MTSLIKESIVDALNKQVKEEFSAEAQYIAIAYYFDGETLPELCEFFHDQAREEHEHGMKLLQYIADAGGHPLVPATVEPKNHFESVEEPVELALKQELKVTDQINKLVDLAQTENDHLTREFLQWFVTEQLEEVSSMTDLLNAVKRASQTNILLAEDFLARSKDALGGEV